MVAHTIAHTIARCVLYGSSHHCSLSLIWGLQCAAANLDHRAVVMDLLRAKADIHKAGNRGGTPLCMAAGRGNLQAVDAMLLAKADPNTSNFQGANGAKVATCTETRNLVQKVTCD